MKVLIVYYSTYGNVYKMAKLVAEGVKEVNGAEPVIRTVPELIPQSVIESRDDMKAGRQTGQCIRLYGKSSRGTGDDDTYLNGTLCCIWE